MADVSMPRLSDSMEEGTILKWLKSDGDEVKRGDELVEIETDKANMTYEADQDGALTIVAQEGDTLPVGETIARIGASVSGDERSEADGGGDGAAPQQQEQPAESESESESEEDEEREAEPAERETATAEAEPEGEPEPAPAPSGENGRTKASPVARRMAR